MGHVWWSGDCGAVTGVAKQINVRSKFPGKLRTHITKLPLTVREVSGRSSS